MSLPVIATALALSLSVSFFFSGIETGIYVLNRVRLRLRAEAGDRRAKRLTGILARPQLLLSTILVGNLLANFAATLLCRSLLRISVAPEAGELLTTLVLTPFLFVFGEVTPKDLFRLRANRWVYRASGALLFASVVLRFPALLLRRLGRMSGVLPTRSASPDEILSRAQIESLVHDVTAEGVLTADQSRMVRNILKLSSIRVTAAMTPFRDGEALVEGFSREDIRRTGAASGLSCLPVRGAEGEDCVGFVDVLDLVFRPDDPPGTLVRPASLVLETSSAGEALRAMTRAGTKLCKVVGEDGIVVGIATLRGLSERIAGEL